VRHDCVVYNPSRLFDYFNPRAYVRHDGDGSDEGVLLKFQSTCLREARRRACTPDTYRSNFNPRAYVRHDIAAPMFSQAAIFQSTCLREARRGCRHATQGCRDFNPRAYVRHDARQAQKFVLYDISIHVPT